MKQIIIVKPGSVDQRTRRFLNKSDVILIEHENPEEVRIVNILDGLDGFDGNAIMLCMARALGNCGHTSARDLFGEYMTDNLVQHLNGAK